jgi:hypothetical protein
MIFKTLGAVAGVLFLSSASMAQTPPATYPQSPTGGPLKSTTGSDMPAPGLSGRHPNATNPSSYDNGTALQRRENMSGTPSSNYPQSPTGGPLKSTTGSDMPAPGLSGRHPNIGHSPNHPHSTGLTSKGNVPESPSSSAPQSPTGGPLKSTMGSNMAAPGLSGRHPNTGNVDKDPN